ncbi:ATP-binding protein [Hydrogenophilus islandicus]
MESDRQHEAWQAVLPLLDRIARALEANHLGSALVPPDWGQYDAFWLRRFGPQLALEPVRHPHRLRLAQLQEIDAQKARVVANTEQFLRGLPANNVLLTGARGCGKSSLVKALLTEYAAQGLRLIEIDKGDLTELPRLLELVAEAPWKFILFIDDLSFEPGEAAYKTLKSVLDGSIWAQPENVLIYATSNRRHLMPEYFAENEATRHVGDEVHPAEATEEKVSLSERFGLWVSFYPFSQAAYLAIVETWLRHFGAGDAEVAAARQEAIVWAIERGSRSGRVAWQFARDWAGRHGLAR